MAKGESCLFVKGLVKQAKARLDTTVQSREEETNSYLSSIDESYEHVCLHIASKLPEKALAALKTLRAAGKDGIKAIVSSANATQQKDIEMFGQAAEVLKSKLEAQSRRKIQSAEKAALEARFQLEAYKRKYEGKSSLDEQESTTAPGPAEDKQGKTRTVNDSPGSAGLGFEQALNRTKRKPPATPPGEPSSPRVWGRKGSLTKGASNVLRIRSPTAKNSAWHEPARASPKGTIFHSPRKSSSRRTSGPRFQRKVHLEAEGPSSPLSQELSNAQSKKDVIWHGEFDDMVPMMRDLFQTQSELNDEWREILEAVNTTESDAWKTDDDDEHEGEVGALHDKLSRLNHDLQEKEQLIGEKDQLISKKEELISDQKSQIDDLEKENRKLGTQCSELKGELQGRDEPDQAPEQATAGTPVTGNLASPRSAKSPAPSGHAGIMASPNTKGLFQQWLTKALHDNRTRLESAVKRCNREEDRCTYDASEMPDDDARYPRKTTLYDWAASSKNHRHDFKDSIDFIDEIMRRTAKTESNSVLSDELGESTPATAMATGTSQANMNLLKPSDSPTSDYGSHASQTSENTHSSSGGSGPSSGDSSWGNSSVASDAKSPIATEQSAAEPEETSTTENISKQEQSLKPDTVPTPSGVTKPEDASELDNVSKNNDTSKSEGSSEEEDASKKKDMPKKQETAQKDKSPESKDDQAPGSSKQNKSSASGHDENDDDPDSPDWLSLILISDLYPKTTDFTTTITQWLDRLWTRMLSGSVVVGFQLGAWVRLFKFVFYYEYYLYHRYIKYNYNRCVKGAPMNKSTTMPMFPASPGYQAPLTIGYQILFVVTFHVYLATQRERAIWYEANGLARKYMLKRAAIAPSSTSIFGIDGHLGLGWYDIFPGMYYFIIVCIFAYCPHLISLSGLFSGVFKNVFRK
ncbi:hypothetical protein FSARC_3250 [Fusarium sarcochroum]|uniref:Uncharacterized protein n=1 Tax=Fusarium sarcochroum TaxID=1208366 RepID=A0A8H4U4R9_9HYPO|nr:hypothetical protein FSARC_3250 [Fusarium sarcochroum]